MSTAQIWAAIDFVNDYSMLLAICSMGLKWLVTSAQQHLKGVRQ